MNIECEEREQAKKRSRRRRHAHRRNGLCLECQRKSVANRRFCFVHLAKARTKAKQEYVWRVAHGICVKCGTPKDEGRLGVNCSSCASRAAAKERKRRNRKRGSIWLMRTTNELQERNPWLSSATGEGREDERHVA